MYKFLCVGFASTVDDTLVRKRAIEAGGGGLARVDVVVPIPDEPRCAVIRGRTCLRERNGRYKEGDVSANVAQMEERCLTWRYPEQRSR